MGEFIVIFLWWIIGFLTSVFMFRKEYDKPSVFGLVMIGFLGPIIFFAYILNEHKND